MSKEQSRLNHHHKLLPLIPNSRGDGSRGVGRGVVGRDTPEKASLKGALKVGFRHNIA